MSNTSLSVPCVSWIVDPDSLRGNYSGGLTTMVIRSASGSKMGIQWDSTRLREDLDFLNIYDGPSAASPLLNVITRSRIIDLGVKSSGSVITLVFRSVGTRSSLTAPWGWRLKISCIQDVKTAADFLPLFQGNQRGNIALNDYDRDGDTDALVGGAVYPNDSHDDSFYVYDRILKPIGNWDDCNMATADFDNDGDKDVFVTGSTNATGVFTRTAMIFENEAGVFSPVRNTPFVPAILGAVSVLDFNGDGKTDIAYSGYNDAGYVFKLYLNDGDFRFKEKELNLPGLTEASMSWFDYDEDGDLDLLYNGLVGTTRVPVGLFINNANQSFTHDTMYMSPTFAGEMKWADVNGDGKADIVNTGFMSVSGGRLDYEPEIFFNNGNKTFTRIRTNIPARSSCRHDWADYDGDGDLDVVLMGTFWTRDTIQQDAAIYKNNSNGNFIKIPLDGIQSLSNVCWVDFNNDSKLDVFVPGRGPYSGSRFYKNKDADLFQVSSYAFTSYEIKGTALVEDFTGDGLVDVLFAGTLSDQDCSGDGKNSVLVKSIGWRTFPIGALTKVADLNRKFIWASDWQINPFWRWGDVNNDGLDDIILTNDNWMQTDSIHIFRNNGDGSFSVLYKGFFPAYYSAHQAGVVDINNDGIKELYIVPDMFYNWNGTGFTPLNNIMKNRCGLNCKNMYFDFGDYNNDGWTDLAYSAGGETFILKNNQGRLENVDKSKSGQYEGKFLRWADFDKDGDLDLLTSYGVLENTAYGGFRYRDADIPEHDFTTIADMNNDGWLDVVAVHHYDNILNPDKIDSVKLHYNQQGKLFFQDATPKEFIEMYGSSYVDVGAFDMDQDGDNDLIYTTYSDCMLSGIYLNNANLRTPNIVLRAPMKKKDYAIGTTLSIKWIGNGLGPSAEIELSLDSGLTWNPIVASAPSSPYGGQYDWLIADVAPSTKCLIRITDNRNNSLIDESSDVFSLTMVTAVSNTPVVQQTKIYPNPVTGTVFLQLKPVLTGKKAVLKIFNASGLLVATKRFVVQQTAKQVDMHPFAGGMYFIRLEIGSVTETYKIFKW